MNATGTAIGFEGKRVAGPRLQIADADGSWIVAGASSSDGEFWHENDILPCLHRDSPPEPVEMGVVEAAPYHDAPGRAVVVWLKCLRRP